MPRLVAFLRAVNVRPRWVKMGELREHLTAAGYADVETHIQSGNVHLAWSGTDPDELAAELTRSISTRWGFEVPTMVRRPEELVDIAETAAALPSPFPPNTPTKRYVSFLSAEPSADAVVRLGAVDAPGERVTVVGRHVVAVLSVPFHEAKLTNVRTERVLGVRSTAATSGWSRRWRSDGGRARARSGRAPGPSARRPCDGARTNVASARNTPRLRRPRH